MITIQLLSGEKYNIKYQTNLTLKELFSNIPHLPALSNNSFTVFSNGQKIALNQKVPDSVLSGKYALIIVPNDKIFFQNYHTASLNTERFQNYFHSFDLPSIEIIPPENKRQHSSFNSLEEIYLSTYQFDDSSDEIDYLSDSSDSYNDINMFDGTSETPIERIRSLFNFNPSIPDTNGNEQDWGSDSSLFLDSES